MNQLAESILRKHGADPAGFAVSSDRTSVWTGHMPGVKATDVWLALRDAFNQTGLWPVIRGEPEERYASEVDVNAILAAVPAAPLREILSFQLSEQRSFAAEAVGLDVPEDASAETLAKMLDAAGAFAFSGRKEPPVPWPTQVPSSEIKFHSVGNVVEGTILPVVDLSLVSLQHPYEAPAYLGFGNWNSCPAPEIQVAALREWYERFGAVPGAITGDVMECVVARPPMDEPDSMALATEQWLFCDDIVAQGTMSVRGLATELWRRPKWFFWWD